MTHLPTSPKEGIYYMLLTPFGWQLMTKCFGPGEDLDHATWWEEEVSRLLGSCWCRTPGGNVRERRHRLASLRHQLANYPYAFPRGRVTKTPETFLVLHGADLRPSMKTAKKTVERHLGLRGACTWLFDEHEQCQNADQEAVCRLLGQKPKWSAV